VASKPQKVVEVLVGGLRCAVPLDRTVEVLPRVEITRLPGLKLPVVGHLRHRDRVLPAVDLRARLGREPAVAPFDEHVLIVSVRREHGSEDRLALLVDRVLGVTELDPEQAEPTTEGLPIVAGMVPWPDGLLVLLEPDRALTAEEEAALHDALDPEEGE